MRVRCLPLLLLLVIILTGCSEPNGLIQPGPLSEAELAQLETLFSDRTTWYPRILMLEFSKGEEIPYYNLVAFGQWDGEGNLLPCELTEAEKTTLVAYCGEEVLNFPTNRLSRETMEMVLRTYYGLSSAEIDAFSFERAIYVPETDHYCTSGICSAMAQLEILSGYRQPDGTITIRCIDRKDWDRNPGSYTAYVATLKQEGERYIVLSVSYFSTWDFSTWLPIPPNFNDRQASFLPVVFWLLTALTYFHNPLL